MPSKLVTDRMAASHQVEMAAARHADAVAAGLAEELASTLQEGETLPDFALTIRMLGRYLAQRSHEMDARDAAHVTELTQARSPREARDLATAALYDKIVEIRRAVEVVYGPEKIKAVLGVEGATPQYATTLRLHAEQILHRLRHPLDELPPSRLAGVVAEVDRWVAEIEPLYEALRQALQALLAKRARARGSLGHKQRAVHAFDNAYVQVGRCLEGLFALAGETALAERVRPASDWAYRRNKKRAARKKKESAATPESPESKGQNAV